TGDVAPDLEVVVEIGLGAGTLRVAGSLHGLPAVRGLFDEAERARDLRRLRCAAAQQRQPLRQAVPQFVAADQLVHLAGVPVRFRGVSGVVGLGARTYAATGEGHLRAGEGEHHIGRRPQGGPYAARRGVVEDGDVR